jgi:hypothetical protein
MFSRTNLIQEYQLKTYCPGAEQMLFLRNVSGLIIESIQKYQAFPASVKLRMNFYLGRPYDPQGH